MDVESGSPSFSEAENASLLQKEENFVVRIKVSDSSVLIIETSKDATVEELKHEILIKMGQEGKHIRLLWAGKLLGPDTAFLSTLKMPSNSWLHCVVSNAPQSAISQSESSIQEEIKDEDFGGRGFDRLRAVGMTTDEIRAIRTTFSTQVDDYISSIESKEGESDLDRRLRAEEEWMDSQADTSEFSLNTRPSGSLLPYRFTVRSMRSTSQFEVVPSGDNVGTARDFAWGFFMGFFLGFIMLFWLWERSVPERQKMGVIVGVTCQLSLNLFKRQYLSASADQQEH